MSGSKDECHAHIQRVRFNQCTLALDESEINQVENSGHSVAINHTSLVKDTCRAAQYSTPRRWFVVMADDAVGLLSRRIARYLHPLVACAAVC